MLHAISTDRERARALVNEIGRQYGLTARLILGDAEFAMRLEFVSFAGATVRIPDSLGLDLRAGQTVVLRFLAKTLAQPVDLQAQIQARKPAPKSIRYEMQFGDPDSLQRKIPARIIGAFNRRRSFRVAPGTRKPVDARIERADGTTLRLPVICMSATGLALLARTAEEKRLMAGDVVTMVFEIPGEGAPITVVGIVRYGKPQRGHVRYGVEFDPKQTRLFLRIETHLNRYVMHQQRKMLSAD